MPGLLDAAPVTVEGKQTLKDNRYGVDTLNDGEEATFWIALQLSEHTPCIALNGKSINRNKKTQALVN